MANFETAVVLKTGDEGILSGTVTFARLEGLPGLTWFHVLRESHGHNTTDPKYFQGAGKRAATSFSRTSMSVS